jgi:hypothetical protein
MSEQSAMQLFYLVVYLSYDNYSSQFLAMTTLPASPLKTFHYLREEVELFCIDHLVMVDIIANEEALIFDFQTVTTPGPGGKVTGLEAVMQVTRGNYRECQTECNVLRSYVRCSVYVPTKTL